MCPLFSVLARNEPDNMIPESLSLLFLRRISLSPDGSQVLRVTTAARADMVQLFHIAKNLPVRLAPLSCFLRGEPLGRSQGCHGQKASCDCYFSHGSLLQSVYRHCRTAVLKKRALRAYSGRRAFASERWNCVRGSTELFSSQVQVSADGGRIATLVLRRIGAAAHRSVQLVRPYRSAGDFGVRFVSVRLGGL